MARITPTRMVLLAKKRQRKLATDGASLLRNKREALLAEFMALIKPLLAQRRDLSERTRKALSALAVAMGIDGPEALASAGMASGADLSVEIKDRKVWGVHLPSLEPGAATKGLLARGYSPFSITSRIDWTAEEFERLLEAVLALVPTEIKLKKMGLEIKKTTRRVNALEQKIIPDLDGEIAFIRQVLEDRGREDTFRLKLLKAKAEKKGGRYQ
ncbi:MAG: V-type ATP synthase subunit D [candidate division WOR-3 bacterium]